MDQGNNVEHKHTTGLQESGIGETFSEEKLAL